MTIRTLTNLGVKSHFGEPTGITLFIAPLVPSLYIGEIYAVNDPAVTGATGEIDGGTGKTDPGRADLRVDPSKFAELLTLAAQPNSVKLLCTLSYDDATAPQRVVDISCRRTAPGVVVTSAGSTE